MKKEEPGSPVPIRDLQERIIEAPQTFSVLDKRQVGKLKKGDTTPSVKNVERWITQNTTAVSVTDFIEGQEGQNLFIKGDGQTTLVHGTKIRTNIAADKLLNNGRMYHLVRFVDAWYEVEGTTSGGTGAVDSVFGRTGAVVAAAGDYDAFYYTQAQLNGGQLDTRYYTEAEIDALLANYYTAAQLDAGQLDTRYYTTAEVDALLAAIDFPVDSVFGRTGAVIAAAGDYDAFYYTEAEIDALLAALTTNSLSDWPADAAGVLTNDGAGNYSWEAPGAGTIDGSGTAGFLSKWSDSNTLTDSALEQTSSDTIVLASNLTIAVTGGGASGSISATDNLSLGSGTGFVILRANGADRWKVDPSNGGFIAETDNSYDIGASGANRPRNLYLGGSPFLGGGIKYAGASAVISPAAFNVNQNNYAPAGFLNALVVRVAANAAGLSITGFDRDGGGHIKVLVNAGANSFQLQHESASSIANQRINTPGSVAYTVSVGAAIILVYDTTSDRWRIGS